MTTMITRLDAIQIETDLLFERLLTLNAMIRENRETPLPDDEEGRRPILEKTVALMVERKRILEQSADLKRRISSLLLEMIATPPETLDLEVN